ncbi:Uncharacterised protein [Vibrio cholerae]|nr:Uncharacterised protein [Vibrio cholerae]
MPPTPSQTKQFGSTRLGFWLPWCECPSSSPSGVAVRADRATHHVRAECGN